MNTNELQKISKRGYYFVDNINEFIPLIDMMYKCPYFIRLSNKFNISMEELEKIVNILKIPHNKMFSFIKHNHGFQSAFSVLVEENTDKKVVNKKGIQHTYYYDTLIVEDTYISLINQDIVSYIFENRYPAIFKHSFLFKEEKRFNQVIEVNPKLKLSEIPLELRFELTCQDIADIIYGNVDFINDVKRISKIKHYADSECFYIELEPTYIGDVKYDKSLAIPYEAIFKKDWSLVENMQVYNIIKKDAKPINGKLGDKNNFFSGSQMYAPYYQDSIEVEKIKKIFIDNF